MSVFVAVCPHCSTKSVAFTIIGQQSATKLEDHLWDTLATCGQCSRGVLATFVTSTSTGQDPGKLLSSGAENLLSLPLISPSPPNTGAPEDTPENVAEYYRQGMENLPGAWDAAGSMFRKVLDTGLKAKFPTIKGTLNQRIDKAADQHELTPALAEWAHKIRLDGNDAAHDEEPFLEEDARTLQTFTELVLTYLFTLPGMLKKARGEAEEKTGADPEPSSGP